MDAGRLQALRRNIRIYYVYRFTSSLQFWMSVSVIYLQRQGLSLGDIGLLETIGGLVVMLAEIPTGAVADLFGRRRSVSLGLFLCAGGLALYGLADSFWLVALSYIPWMIGYTMTSGADSALLYDSMKALGQEDGYARAEGQAMTLMSGGGAVAGIAGSFAAAGYGYQAPIWLTLIVSVAGGFVALLFHEPPRTGAAAKSSRSLAGQFRSAARILVEQKALLYLMAFGALISGIAFVLKQSYFQVFAQAIGLPVSMFGLLALALTAAGMLGSSLSGRLVHGSGQRPGLLLIASLMGLCFMGMAAVRSLPGLAFVVAVPFLSALLRPALMAAVNERISSGMRATVLSAQSLLWAFVFTVLGPLIGFMADASVPLAFLALGLSLFGAAPLLWILASKGLMKEETALGRSTGSPVDWQTNV